MAAYVATSDSGYNHRPSIRTQPARPPRADGPAGRHATGRAVDRMRLAFRAYEQRAESRAALRGWLAARAALSTRT